jgi:hypothetical protein
MENKTELYKAIASVMKDVKGIDKSMTIGTGNNAYKGISDKDVKSILGKAMNEHGLIMLPKSYEPLMRLDRWEEIDPYSKSNPPAMKTKQSVFVEVKAVYSLIHVETGQSVDIPAYGHGVDSQDKAAGKATTYAMKTAALYAFFVPTGAIDDTDNTHSNDIETPKQKTPAPAAKTPAPEQKKKVETEEQFTKVVEWVQSGKGTLDKAKSMYDFTAVQLDDLKTILNQK